MLSNIHAYVCKRGKRDRGRELILKSAYKFDREQWQAYGKVWGEEKKGKIDGIIILKLRNNLNKFQSQVANCSHTQTAYENLILNMYLLIPSSCFYLNSVSVLHCTFSKH